MFKMTLPLLLAAAVSQSPTLQAATFNIGDGDVAGLIGAIQTANTNGDPVNVINLAPKGTYTLTAVAENPPEFNSAGAVGLPVVRGNVTINGNGATIQRSTASGTPDFVLLAVSGRTASCGDGSCFTNPILTINQTILTGGSYGGLQLNSATAVVQGSTLTQNTGGGITNACGRLTLLNSTISYNSFNSAWGGGGILLWSFSCAVGTPYTNISFSTIFNNTNTDWARGNAIGTGGTPNPGTVVLKNSILASPAYPGEPVCNNGSGHITSLGHNILGNAFGVFGSVCANDLTAPGDMILNDPLLGALGDNGGPTPTDLPLRGSPAIDAVPLASCSDVFGNPVTADQRGAPRPQGAACDIGSVEFGGFYNLCLLYNPNKPVPSGGTDPIKLELCDGNATDLSSSSIVLHATGVSQTSTSISGDVQSPGNANPDNDFRFDPTLGPNGGYIFNLGTRGLATGSYSLNFTVAGDPFVYSAPFQVK
jgi:hypothetical protein